MRLPAGYASRPASSDDLDAIAGLFAACDRVDVGFEVPVRDQIRDEWRRPGFEVDRHTAVVARASTLVAYAEVFGTNPDAVSESFVRVHPGHRGRGLGAAILRWTEEGARGLAAADSSPVLRVHAPHTDEGARRLLGASGFTTVRVFWHMERSLAGAVEAAELPDGVHVRTMREDDAGVLYDTIVESFEDHWGWDPPSRADHDAEMRRYDPALVRVAVHGNEIVGLSIAKLVDRGGWIDVVGVRPRWRGRGLGRALLLRSFADLADRGVAGVTLNVDAGNETGATRLYESVGMRVYRAWEVYEKPLVASVS